MDDIYDRIGEIDKRVLKLEEAQPFLKDMLERNTASSEKLVETLHEMEMSMVKINDKIDGQSAVIENMRQDFEKATEKSDERIASISRRVSVVEGQSKLDVIEYIKKYFPWIVIILGVSVSCLSKYFKF